MTALAKALLYEKAAPVRAAMPASDAVSVESADACALAGLDAAWRDLLSRAAERNPFMDPALLQASAIAYPDMCQQVLLAWDKRESGRLVGVWAFCVRRAPKALLPVKISRTPAFSHGFLGTPVIDRAMLEPVLAGMLDRIASLPDCPNQIAIDMMDLDGATMAALARVAAERGNTPVVLEVRSRPLLKSGQDPDGYFKDAMSSSSRKKLRQMRSKLSREGEVTSEIVTDPEAVSRALEEFLGLEASGWKKENDTALLCDDQDTRFFRVGFTALAEAGRARIYSLRLDGRPVAMQIVALAGSAASTWKTAYDQAFAAYSPGSLLFVDYTTDFLEDNGIETVDSCSEDDSGYMAMWTGRKRMSDVRITASHGMSPAFRLTSAVELAFRAGRRLAKRYYLNFKQKSGKRS